MPTIQNVIAQCENELADAEDSEARARAELGGILAAAEREQRANLNVSESARSDVLFKSIEHARAAQRRARTALERAREVEADEARIDCPAAGR